MIRPCQGERVSGDAVVIHSLEQGLFVAIVDVLGHGTEANELTHVIEAYLNRYYSRDVSGVIERLHQHLKGTRGAAVGLCAIDKLTGRIDRTPDGTLLIGQLAKGFKIEISAARQNHVIGCISLGKIGSHLLRCERSNALIGS